MSFFTKDLVLLCYFLIHSHHRLFDYAYDINSITTCVLPSQILLETLTECRAVDKAVLLCVNLDRFPAIDEFQEGTIDVWWIVHDGGLLLLLAHLLQQHKIWRKCKLRVHTVAEKLDNSEVVKKNLEKLLELVSTSCHLMPICILTFGLE